MQEATTIAGYSRGASDLAPSPLSLADLAELQKSLLFTDDDRKQLKAAHDVLKPQVDAILDVWYGFVGANPHLLRYFVDDATKQPDGAYLDAVRKRFGQWILDTTAAAYDQSWLDYQYEIGLRHHRLKKNKTDGANAPAHIPLRHVLALAFPIAVTVKPFLAKGGASPEAVDAMHAAWTKSVLLTVILWAHPYVHDGEF